MDNPAVNYLEVIKTQLDDGLIDPIRAYIRLYEIEKLAAEYRRQSQDEAISKRDLIGGKTHIQDGYEVVVQSRQTWSYSADEEYERLQVLLKNRQSLMKQAYASSQRGSAFADENGVIVEPAEVKTTTSIMLKHHKNG